VDSDAKNLYQTVTTSVKRRVTLGRPVLRVFAGRNPKSPVHVVGCLKRPPVLDNEKLNFLVMTFVAKSSVPANSP